MGMREKILFVIAVFALAGMMVPMTANATHDGDHKSKLMIKDCSGGVCAIWIDNNNNGQCEFGELTRNLMKVERVIALIELGVIAVCASGGLP